MKTYQRRIRLIDQRMYAAWRIGVDQRKLREMMNAQQAVIVTLTAWTRDFAAACVKITKSLEPLIVEAKREQAVQDAIARQQEFDV